MMMLKNTFLRTAFLVVLTNPACLSVAGNHIVNIPENENIAAAVASESGADVEFDIHGILVPGHGAKLLKLRATSAFGKDSTYRIDEGEILPVGSMRQVLVSSDEDESLAVISVDVNGGEAVGFMTVGKGQNSLFGLKQGPEGNVTASDPEAFTPPAWSCGVDDVLVDDLERRMKEDNGATEAHHHDHLDEEQDHVHFKPGLEGLESLSKSLRKTNLRDRDSRRLTTAYNYIFEVKLYLEIDSLLYSSQGKDVNNVVNYVNLLVSAANKIFEKEILTHLTIQHIQIYKTAISDPYNSATGTRNALDIMQSMFNGTTGGTADFGGGDGEIDIHHALLGKKLGGGIAYTGVLCNKRYGFGVSASITGEFNNQNLDSNVQGTVWDLYVFAHELGHSFGSIHTQCYSPPVDECYSCQSNKKNKCPGPTIVNQGAATLMAYCQHCGGYDNIAYTFGGYYDDSTSAWEPNRQIDSLNFSLKAERVPQTMYAHVDSRGECVSFTPPEPPTPPTNRSAGSQGDSPVPSPCPSAGCQGDPHFKTWRGQHFDFHGECDLVLLHSSAFESGLGLDVHIRTKIRRDMSYISSAVLRIGTDVLEVESQGIYYLNGVAGAALPAEFSGFVFSHTQPTAQQHVFAVNLGGIQNINVKTYKDFVSVLIEQGQHEHFGDSVGLMGDFGQGRMIARDGKTVLDDANAFGQEWQVLDTEPSLFQTLRLPQYPLECTPPLSNEATSQLRRRLLESTSADQLAAEKACAHWGEEGKDDCVFDVLTTGDLEMAVVGAY